MEPLRRNRDFMLLQVGQLLSSAGTSASSLAYPLLVLALTHSAVQTGLVETVSFLPALLFSLVAGVAADRWRRKRVMVAADVARAVTVGTLAALIASGHAAFWLILVAAFLEAAGATFFGTAQIGALRSVVPRAQLADAAGVQAARGAAVRLGGPPLGGALFSIARSLPFVADACSYAASTVSLLAMRTPFQEVRERDSAPIRTQLADGFRFLWHHDFLRTVAFIYGLGNFLIPGVLLVVVVAGSEQGLSSATIGILLAFLGVAALVGSLASPLTRRIFGVRTILLLELWTWTGCWVFVAKPNVWALLAVIVPFGLAAPVTDSVTLGLQMAMTPDRLVGRVESVRRTIAVAITPLGPLVAGLLLGLTSARATVAFFAICGLGLALWGTLSPAIRQAPSLADLSDPATLSA
jgi:predicted MFS family arabinose efflux permease